MTNIKLILLIYCVVSIGIVTAKTEGENLELNMMASGAESLHVRNRRSVSGKYYTYENLGNAVDESTKPGYIYHGSNVFEGTNFKVTSSLYTINTNCYENIVIEGRGSSAVRDSLKVQCLSTGELRSVRITDGFVVIGNPDEAFVASRQSTGIMVVVEDGKCTKLVFSGLADPQKVELKRNGCKDAKQAIAFVTGIAWTARESPSSNGDSSSSEQQTGSRVPSKQSPSPNQKPPPAKKEWFFIRWIKAIWRKIKSILHLN